MAYLWFCRYVMALRGKLRLTKRSIPPVLLEHFSRFSSEDIDRLINDALPIDVRFALLRALGTGGNMRFVRNAWQRPELANLPDDCATLPGASIAIYRDAMAFELRWALPRWYGDEDSSARTRIVLPAVPFNANTQEQALRTFHRPAVMSLAYLVTLSRVAPKLAGSKLALLPPKVREFVAAREDLLEWLDHGIRLYTDPMRPTVIHEGLIDRLLKRWNKSGHEYPRTLVTEPKYRGNTCLPPHTPQAVATVWGDLSEEFAGICPAVYYPARWHEGPPRGVVLPDGICVDVRVPAETVVAWAGLRTRLKSLTGVRRTRPGLWARLARGDATLEPDLSLTLFPDSCPTALND